MIKELRNDILKIVLTSILLGFAIYIEHTFNLEMWQYLLIFLVPYLLIGFDVLKEAFEKLFSGEFFEEDFLMSLATMIALFIGFIPNAEPCFGEAVFVMLFFKIGELFEEIAEGKTEKSIEELMEIRPDVANLCIDGEIKKVNPNEVKVGDIIEVYPGEKVPLDGIVLKGSSTVNTAALTGESVPQILKENDTILSGFVNLSGILKVKVSKEFGESTASKIIELVKNATENKSKSEKFITKFSRIYTPIVVVLAIILAIIPPLITGNFEQTFPVWLFRSLSFLIVSCPCALVISVPLAFFGGIGKASKNGILIKGSSYLEILSKAKNCVFDKTGTLTKGVFEVIAIHPEIYDEERLLHLAAHVERFSKHPIAISLKNAYPNEDDDCTVTDVTDIAGQGIKAKVNDDFVAVGNSKLMDSLNINWKPCEVSGTIVHVAINDEYFGHIVISDRLKEGSREAINELKAEKMHTVMLTGDQKDSAEAISNELGIEEYFYGLLPEEKSQKIQEIITSESKEEKTIFVGDGINDAIVLAKADLGVAMGCMGQDAAIEIADVVLMDDNIEKIPLAIKIAKYTKKIVKQNIAFTLLVKILVLILACFGYAPMWLAVFADVGVTVLAVLNAVRVLK